MPHPWTTLDRVDTPDGTLELRRRDDDWLITVAGRVLMNSRASRSELALGELAARAACEAAGDAPARLLVGGLGMACTLRAALDELPAAAEVVVRELHECVVRWCEGPLAPLTDAASADSRVRLELGDVADAIASAAERGPRFHAIALDLYEGPHAGRGADRDPLFGTRALERTRRALLPRGTFALWTEHRDAAFEKRLRRSGFAFEVRRPGRGGLRHAVYLARAAREARAR